MQFIWNRVSQEIINVLTIHPQVKGFQILDDQGKAFISGYSGRWIPDVPFRRKSVMKLFNVWRSASNSSPVEGIMTALKQYKKPGQSIAIYVFGDDYTGASYDNDIANITKMNTNQKKWTTLSQDSRCWFSLTSHNGPICYSDARTYKAKWRDFSCFTLQVKMIYP